MTPPDMIMSQQGGLTFMYRVGGIAVSGGRLLVEHDVRHGLCFVPGGRVEYGETAAGTLVREVREELGEEVAVGRLVFVSDHTFELDDERFQEVALYFVIEFGPGSPVAGRGGRFAGVEPGTTFEWIPLESVEAVGLFPAFLRARVGSLPGGTEYVVESGVEWPSGES